MAKAAGDHGHAFMMAFAISPSAAFVDNRQFISSEEAYRRYENIDALSCPLMRRRMAHHRSRAREVADYEDDFSHIY